LRQRRLILTGEVRVLSISVRRRRRSFPEVEVGRRVRYSSRSVEEVRKADVRFPDPCSRKHWAGRKNHTHVNGNAFFCSSWTEVVTVSHRPCPGGRAGGRGAACTSTSCTRPGYPGTSPSPLDVTGVLAADRSKTVQQTTVHTVPVPCQSQAVSWNCHSGTDGPLADWTAAGRDDPLW
jgi:hypothetical protein